MTNSSTSIKPSAAIEKALVEGVIPRHGLWLSTGKNEGYTIASPSAFDAVDPFRIKPDDCIACAIGLIIAGTLGKDEALNQLLYPSMTRPGPTVVHHGYVGWAEHLAPTLAEAVICPVSFDPDDEDNTDKYCLYADHQVSLSIIVEHLFEAHRWEIGSIIDWLKSIGQ